MIVLTVVTALTALAALVGAMTVVGRDGGFGRIGRPRAAGSTSDFLVASRAVTPLWNASAISGEYISAAAFLGAAGLVLAYGVDMLWLPIGAAAGYVVLLAFVTAPLRRSGAYTISDFAQWRLGSVPVRRMVSVCVCFIGWFYLLPQFQGAGVTLRVVAGLPVWAGWALVVTVVMVIVLSGGMRSITVVQAYQFWLKLIMVALPAVALLAAWRLDGGADPTAQQGPRFRRTTTVAVETRVAVRAPADTPVTVSGVLDGRRHRDAALLLTAGLHEVGDGTTLRFPGGAAVPHAERLRVRDGRQWAVPFGRGREHPMYATYAALIGMLLGAMGLPHILMRFYTNTCGRAARRTAALVPLLLSLFYVFPTLYGALGRLYTPELLMTGDTDATILMLPQRLAPGPPGALLTGLVAAGAFAAFTSTSCGIVVAVAGTISQCVLRGGVRSFRIAALVAPAVPLAVMIWARPSGSVGLVTLAFVVSACSLCPLLLLGVWWRRLTTAGAAAGLLVGGGLAVATGVVQIFGGPRTGWWGELLAQPTPVLAPVSFAVMIVVSLLTPGRVPRQADRAMTRLHLPEELTGAGDRPLRMTGVR